MYVKTFKFKNKDMTLRTIENNTLNTVKFIKLSAFESELLNKFIKTVLYIHTTVNGHTIENTEINPTISTSAFSEYGSTYTNYVLVFNDVDPSEITTNSIKSYWKVANPSEH